MRALELDPKMQVAQRNLEIAYFNTGLLRPRVAELNERLRVRPEDRDARWELGRTSCAARPDGRRRRRVHRAAAVPSDDVGALVQLGLAEKDERRPRDRALGYLERALTLDPASAVVHFYVGEVLYNRGLNEDALAALRRAVELNPDNPDALLPDGVRARRHGPPRGGARGRRGARSSSIPRCRARTRTSRSTRTATARRAIARARRARDADGGARRGTARALQPRPRVPAEGLLRRGAAGVREGARHAARIAQLVLQAMAEVHLLRQRGDGRGRRCTTSCWSSSRTARSCGTSAASRCTRTASSPRRRRATGAPCSARAGLCARATTTSAWRCITAATPRTRSTRSASRSTRSRRSSRRGSTSRCC